LKRALHIAETADDKGEQAAALSQMGSLYYTTSRLMEAEQSLKSATDIYSAAPPKSDLTYKSALEIYAKVLYKLNRAGEADVLYAKIRTLNK
jgi:hypothetical protein